MLDKDHPELSLKVQAELLGISYSSLFYQPVLPSPRELAIKRRIDEIYTACPFYGSRKIAILLQPEFGVSRPTVQAYMREMGIAAIVPGPNTSQPTPEHSIYPYLLKNVTAQRPNHIWGIEIVFTQMTKTRVFAIGAGGDHVANFHFIVGHDHAINQQFNQLASLFEGGIGKSLLYTGTEIRDGLGQANQFLLPIRLYSESVGLGFQPSHPLL